MVRYLKYLDCVGSARQTLRSYAYSLEHYWEYLTQQQLNWQQVTLDDLSRFVLWLKLPSWSLKVLPAHPVPQARSNRTITHALTVVRSFYDYHWRREEVERNVKETTTTFLPARARRSNSLLHHLTKGSPVEKNILKQKEARRLRPKTITKDQVKLLLDACCTQRDRLLVRLLYDMNRQSAWGKRSRSGCKMSMWPKTRCICVIGDPLRTVPRSKLSTLLVLSLFQQISATRLWPTLGSHTPPRWKPPMCSSNARAHVQARRSPMQM